MLSCSRLFTFLLVLGGLLLSKPTYACGAYCGAYSVGGYDLLGWAVSVETVVDYSSAYQNYGGSCASLTTACNSCYDVSLMNGYNNLNSYYNTILDNQINTLINQINYPGFNHYPVTYPGMNPGGSYLGGGFQGGYPSQVPPYMPFNPTQFPTQYPGTPTMTPYTPTFQNPVYGQTPYFPGVSIPPYGGCDNVTVMCPTGPTVRNNPVTVPTVSSPVTTTGGNDPIRYQVPRGIVTTH